MAVQHIDLNRASAEEIAQAGNIDTGRATMLVEYRDEHGPFESWDEVATVPGFNEQVITSLQEAGARLGAVEEEDEDID
jgi:competence protein ComEA